MAEKMSEADRQHERQKEQERRKEREVKKQERRKQQIGTPRSYKLWDKKRQKNIPVDAKFDINEITLTTTIPSSDKEISCRFRLGKSIVPRKVRLYGDDTWVGVPGEDRIPLGECARDLEGSKIIVQVAMRTIFVSCIIDGKDSFEGRSVCKPPDVWNIRAGIKHAMRHLFQNITFKKHLEKGDYEPLLQAFLTKPPTPSKILAWKKNKKKRKKQKEAAK